MCTENYVTKQLIWANKFTVKQAAKHGCYANVKKQDTQQLSHNIKNGARQKENIVCVKQNNDIEDRTTLEQTIWNQVQEIPSKRYENVEMIIAVL